MFALITLNTKLCGSIRWSLALLQYIICISLICARLRHALIWFSRWTILKMIMATSFENYACATNIGVRNVLLLDIPRWQCIGCSSCENRKSIIDVRINEIYNIGLFLTYKRIFKAIGNLKTYNTKYIRIKIKINVNTCLMNSIAWIHSYGPESWLKRGSVAGINFFAAH